MINKEKSSNGITLIALIITIVLMIILAGVTISMLVNDEIFDYAGQAVEETKNAINQEQQLVDDVVNKYFKEKELTMEEIVAEANKNPNAYKHKEQLTSTCIAIGTDGNPVNMDLWEPTLLDDGTWLLGNNVDHYVESNAYKGGYTNGTIQGKVPQYIYNSTTKTFTAVTKMRNTFTGSSIVVAPELPTTVTDISFCFALCKSLEDAPIVPESVLIMNRTFYECMGMKSVTIPKSVKSVGNCCFYSCTELSSISIPVGVESIEYMAFGYCDKLVKVIIPKSVTSIGDYAFRDCKALSTLTVPSSVTSIGTNAFLNVPKVIYNGSATGSPWGATSVSTN